MLQWREVREQHVVLRAHPEGGARGGAVAHDAVAADAGVAGGWREEAGQAGDRSALAGACVRGRIILISRDAAV